MEPVRLRTSHMENPLGMDGAPYFSWAMTSEERNVMQTAYRLVVSSGGGFIPSVDHQTPPDVSAENYAIYRKLQDEFCERHHP